MNYEKRASVQALRSRGLVKQMSGLMQGKQEVNPNNEPAPKVTYQKQSSVKQLQERGLVSKKLSDLSLPENQLKEACDEYDQATADGQGWSGYAKNFSVRKLISRAFVSKSRDHFESLVVPAQQTPRKSANENSPCKPEVKEVQDQTDVDSTLDVPSQNPEVEPLGQGEHITTVISEAIQETDESGEQQTEEVEDQTVGFRAKRSGGGIGACFSMCFCVSGLAKFKTQILQGKTTTGRRLVKG